MRDTRKKIDREMTRSRFHVGEKMTRLKLDVTINVVSVQEYVGSAVAC